MFTSALAELGTGQVAFLSGLMAGFSVTVAIHILRRGLRDPVSEIVFYLLLITTFLFMVSLYTEVRLTIEIAGAEELSDEANALLSQIRLIGTLCATSGFCLFIFSIGLLGWIGRPLLGFLTTFSAILTFAALGYIWMSIRSLQAIL